MKPKLKKAGCCLLPMILGLGWLAVLGWFIGGWFLTCIDPVAQQGMDAFGRTLTQTPLAARWWVLGSAYWPGLKWTIVDYAVFWSFVAFTISAVVWLNRAKEQLQAGEEEINKVLVLQFPWAIKRPITQS